MLVLGLPRPRLYVLLSAPQDHFFSADDTRTVPQLFSFIFSLDRVGEKTSATPLLPRPEVVSVHDSVQKQCKTVLIVNGMNSTRYRDMYLDN